MSTATIGTRPAEATDNDALLALSDACPMHGAISLRIDRRPDFFAFAALEREWSTVEVVDGDDALAGCIAIASRAAWINGRQTPISYVGDLKVHPQHRQGRVADTLIRRSVEVSAELVGERGTVLCSTLSGNRAMERRAAGGPELPVLERIATVRAHALPLLWHPGVRQSRGPMRVVRATVSDAEEMSALWASVAPRRQLAPQLDAETIARWMAAPGLSYRLARTRDGRLTGFLALWDQRAIKQLRVLRYSRSLARVRAMFNLAAPIVGAARLPVAGAPLRLMETLHLCVPSDQPSVLRTLALAAHRELRGTDLAFFTIALDARDPLTAALAGLWSQPTDVDIRLTSPTGRYAGRALDQRPVHYETALV